MRRQSCGRNARRHFLLSGFSNDTKFELCIKIKNLGGIYNETDHFQVESTHIVCKKPSRSEKFLGGCATGKWLLVPEYIEESSRHGRWLPEQEYEWAEKWRNCIDPSARQFLSAPRKWREKKKHTSKGAFAGWRAAVLVENATKQIVYKKLLQIGSAHIESSPFNKRTGSQDLSQSFMEQAEYLTHVFADDSQANLVSPLLAMGIFCLKPVYIGDFLLQENPPDPRSYLLGELYSIPDMSIVSSPGKADFQNNRFDGKRLTRRSLHCSNFPQESTKQYSRQKERRSLPVNCVANSKKSSENKNILSPKKSENDVPKKKVSGFFKAEQQYFSKSVDSEASAKITYNSTCADDSSDCQIVLIGTTVKTKSLSSSQNSPVSKSPSRNLQIKQSKNSIDKKDVPLKSKNSLTTGKRSKNKDSSHFHMRDSSQLILVRTPTKSIELQRSPCKSMNRKRPSDENEKFDLATPMKKQKINNPKPLTTRKSKRKGNKDSPSLQKLNQSSIMCFVQKVIPDIKVHNSVSSQKSTAAALDHHCDSPEVLTRNSRKVSTNNLQRSNSPLISTRSQQKDLNSVKCVPKDKHSIYKSKPANVENISRSETKSKMPHLTVISSQKMTNSNITSVNKISIQENVNCSSSKAKVQLIFKSSVKLTDIRNSPAISADIIQKGNVVNLRSWEEMGKENPKIKKEQEQTDPHVSPRFRKGCNNLGLVHNFYSSNDKQKDNDRNMKASKKETVKHLQKNCILHNMNESDDNVHKVIGSEVYNLNGKNRATNTDTAEIRKSNSVEMIPKSGSSVITNRNNVKVLTRGNRKAMKQSLSSFDSLDSNPNKNSIDRRKSTMSSQEMKDNCTKVCKRKKENLKQTSQSSVAIKTIDYLFVPDKGLNKVNTPVAKCSIIDTIASISHDKNKEKEHQDKLNLCSSNLTVEHVRRNISGVLSECSKIILTMSEKQKYAQALALKEKRKEMQRNSHLLINKDFTNSGFDQEATKGQKGYPMSENYAAIYDTCLEEGLMKEALNVISSSLCSTRYPQPKTLYSMLTAILQVTDSSVVANKTYNILQQILMLHPPCNALMQEVYLKALWDPRQKEDLTHGKEWNLVADVIRSCVSDIGSGGNMNNLLLLKFLVDLWEVDLKYYISRRSCKKFRTMTQKSCLLAQILWPTGALATGRINMACQELINQLIDATNIECYSRKVEVVNLLQRMISITAESCHYSNGTKSITPGHLPSGKVTLFAREIALKMRGKVEDRTNIELLLVTMKPEWLVLLVCEHLLEFYDESLLPLVEEYDKSLTLKKIVARYFYLLPSLTTVTAITPHKKKKQEKHIGSNSCSQSSENSQKNQPLKMLADSNHANNFKFSSRPSKNETTLKKKMAAINKRNAKGETALHKACIANNVPKIKELLLTPGIDVNMKDYAGWTPLHEACNYGHAEALVELLQYRPAKTISSFFKKDPSNNRKLDLLAFNDEGITPLHDAVENNHIHIVGILLHHGGKKLLEARTKSGCIARDLAATPDMKYILDNPPEHNLTSPTKRKYVQSISSQESGVGSQSLSQTLLCNTATYQPTQDLYTEILDSTHSKQYVLSSDLHKFACIVCHMLKSYIKVYDLVKINNYCKMHEEGSIDLKSLVDDDRGNNDVLSSQGSTNSSQSNTQESTVDELMNADENIAEHSKRTRTRGRKSVASIHSMNRNVMAKDCTLSKPVPSDLDTLEEDLEIFGELKYHVRSFQTHVSWLSQNSGQESLSLHVKKYILIMRALHL